MKYLKTFEKLGIDEDLENQCEYIFKYINSPENKDKNEFRFIYHSNKGNIGFNLVINSKLEGCYGQFSHNLLLGHYKIELLEREDKSVLLHELKHLDYVIKNKKANSDKIIKDIQKYDGKESDGIKMALYLFYIFDTDEFQSKYHGYYSRINSFISDHVSNNPTRKEIVNFINSSLKENDDKAYTYYITESEFKFSDYGVSDDDLNKILVKYIRKKDNMDITHSNIFKEIAGVYIWGAKEFYSTIKNKLGIITSSEKRQIREIVKKLEKDINWKKRKYKKKFMKIVQLMYDKYLPKKLNR